MPMEKSNLLFINSFFEAVKSKVDTCFNLSDILILIIELVDDLPFSGGLLTL
jgi:hypothetical protein